MVLYIVFSAYDLDEMLSKACENYLKDSFQGEDSATYLVGVYRICYIFTLYIWW